MSCPLCSRPISGSGLPYSDPGWTDRKIFAQLRVHHCDGCGFGFSAPELPGEAVNLYYQNQYRAKSSTFYLDFSRAVPSGVGDIRTSRAFAQLALASARIEFRERDVLLDVGPGWGESFAIARSLLAAPQLAAVELSGGARDFYRRNYGAVSYDSLEHFAQAGPPAKIVLMSHSLEHYRLSDLPPLFDALAKALGAGGVLVVEVPHVDLRRHAAVRGPDAPHFLFFSRASLALLMEKFGFEVLFLNTCGDYWRYPEAGRAQPARSIRFKAALKPHYNRLPIGLQVRLRAMVRLARRAGGLGRPGLARMETLPIQSYGGDRDCLRLVARVRGSRT